MAHIWGLQGLNCRTISLVGVGVMLTHGLMAGFLATAAVAESIAPDGQLSTTVQQREPNQWTIEGGDRAGSNLFHSFQQFSIPTGGLAHFNNAADVANIFARVTGGQRSLLDGTLRANGAANLFLLNPAGILFGPNARLDLGGSFFASTADRLVFADGLSFGVNDAAGRPLLSMSVPMGLQYGAAPGPIRVEARSLDPTATLPTGLEVKPGQAIGLFGGAIKLDGGVLIAPRGRLQLIASPPDATLAFNTPIATIQATNFGSIGTGQAVISPSNILLTNKALLDVRDLTQGGTVELDGHNILLNSGSQIFAGVRAPESVDGVEPSSIAADQVPLHTLPISGDIRARATDTITLDGGLTFFSNAVDPNAMGNAGNTTVQAQSIQLSNGGRIYTGTEGVGNAGNLKIIADQLMVAGSSENPFLYSGILNLAEVSGTGDGGLIDIQVGSIHLLDGGSIRANTAGLGNAGRIMIRATGDVLIEGVDTRFGDVDRESSGIYSRSAEDSTGNGGTIDLQARSLTLRDGGFMTATTRGTGNAGNLLIHVTDGITISGVSQLDEVLVFPENEILIFQQSSGLYSSASRTSKGEGGNIQISAGSLSIDRGGLIITRTDGGGNAGSIRIQVAGDMVIDGVGPDLSSSAIISSSEGKSLGRGGSIQVEAQSLTVSNGAVINTQTLTNQDAGSITLTVNRLSFLSGGQAIATTTKAGHAGDITISADQVLVEGFDPRFAVRQELFSENVVGRNLGSFSGVFVGADVESTGEGGSLDIQAGSLTLQPGTTLAVGSSGSGAAGRMRLVVDQLQMNNGHLSAETRSGAFGGIQIDSQGIELRERSLISTNAQGEATGGNIVIDTDTLVALENSDIAANSVNSFGGRVNLRAQGVFGTAFREALTDRSDITASSARGPEFSGTVQLEVLNPDPARGAIALPTAVGVPPKPTSPCGPRSDPGAIEFFALGRAGQAPNPIEAATLETMPFAADLRPIAPTTTAQAETTSPLREPILEATHWQRTETGQIQLVAAAPVQWAGFDSSCRWGAEP
ncbi:MAG: filamentous hemagglutinin N-terminal domain-containing protein [Limnothrix sp. CACIAM 69d]|nr:MAG: filamentous hemagglutinin N-terminal domain-containing protein [Limnothrix sp. CACIAM 69d]